MKTFRASPAFFAFLFPWLAIATTWAGPAPLTQAQLAEKLRFYQGIRTLEVRFEQVKTLKEMDLKLKSEGELKIERPKRFVWKVLKPSPVSVSISGQELSIVTGTGASAKTQVLKLGEAPSESAARGMASMVAWLNMDAAALHREYDVFADGPRLFRFAPKGQGKQASPITSLSMELTEAGHLKNLKIEELSGDTLDIHFDKPKVVQAK